MDTRESIIAILGDVKPTRKMDDVTDIIDGGYIDSFELMSLISKLDEVFGIEIGIDDMTTENFNSVDAMEALVTRLKK